MTACESDWLQALAHTHQYISFNRYTTCVVKCVDPQFSVKAKWDMFRSPILFIMAMNIPWVAFLGVKGIILNPFVAYIKLLHVLARWLNMFSCGLSYRPPIKRWAIMFLPPSVCLCIFVLVCVFVCLWTKHLKNQCIILNALCRE